MRINTKWIYALFFATFVGTSCLAFPKEKSNLPNKHEEGPVDLELTKQELKEMSKWKNKPFESLIADASNGDRAALYMIGMTYLTGVGGLSIDVKEANRYFVADIATFFGHREHILFKSYSFASSLRAK